jgi:hypothetical protein
MYTHSYQRIRVYCHKPRGLAEQTWEISAVLVDAQHLRKSWVLVILGRLGGLVNLAISPRLRTKGGKAWV